MVALLKRRRPGCLHNVLPIMLHSLQSVLGNRGASLDETDRRHFIQSFLRGLLHTEALYCEHAHHGVVVVRVGSATLRQEVILLQHDVACMLEREFGFLLTTLRVIQ